MGDIKEFLESTGIQDVQKWCEIFEDEGIDMVVLKGIKEKDLTEMEMNKKGHRIKLLSALRKGVSTDVFSKSNTTEDVKQFLTSTGIQNVERWYDIFVSEGIDMIALEAITASDLQDIGMTKMGDRIKVMTFKESRLTPEESNTTLPVKQDTESTTMDQPENGSADAENDVPFENNEGGATLFKKISLRKSESRSLLTETYKHILQIFKSGEIFQDILNEIETEHGNIQLEIKKRILDLENDECPIVIAGETSAGKSSFVNVLLGIDLLPKSSLVCTSTICRIYKKDEKEVYLTDFNDKRTKVSEFDTSKKDIKDLKDLLKKYVSVRPNTEQEIQEEYKYVDIYWPIKHLNGDIVIVDTPGLSPDNENLNKRLFSYLPNALAFIYLINTPNAGGVQSDRILRIQEEIAKHFPKNKTFTFDPDRMIFVCNKWDQIHEDPEEVFESVKSELRKSWTGFQEKKLFKLSTFKEQKKLSKGKMSSEYKDVLKGIESMIPAAIEEKIRRHMLWQQILMEGVSQKLRIRMISTLKSKEENEMHLTQISHRLENLERAANSLYYTIANETIKESKDIADALFDYMHSPVVISRMFAWKSDDLPEKDKMVKIESIIEYDIQKRVYTELRCAIAAKVERISNKMKTFVQVKIYEIDNEMIEIDHFMLNEQNFALPLTTNVGIGDNISGIGPPYLRLTMTNVVAAMAVGTMAMTRHTMSMAGSMLTGSTTAASLGLTLWTVGAIPLLIPPLSIAVFGAQQLMENMDNNKKVSKYKENKVEFANNRGKEYLKKHFTRKYFERIADHISENALSTVKKYFEEIFPKRINAKRKLVENIKEDLRTPHVIRRQCQHIENIVKPAYGHIVLENILLFSENVLSDRDVKIQWSGPLDAGTKCEIRQKEKWLPANATVKPVKLSNVDRWKELADVWRFSQHSHKNIIRFFGISSLRKSAEEGLIIYSEDITCRLDEIALKSDFEWTSCRKLLLDVLEGLSYLHDCGCVHQNLKLENIAILYQNGDMQTKLCMGDTVDPTKLAGPISDVPIIVAPEVKDGGPCGFESDIYQFGFILYKCLCKKRAFFENGKCLFSTYEDLYEYIRKGKIDFRLLVGTLHNEKEIFVSCCSLDPANRPTAKHAKRLLLKC